MMPVKPIPFSTEMVRAILDGRKTQTRKVVKPQPPASACVRNRHGGTWDWAFWADSGWGHVMKPPYRPGDILWVREAFFKFKERYYYKADGKHETLDALIGGSFFEWHRPICMPKEAARIFLRIKDVRAERLQDMKEKDAILEGSRIGLGGLAYFSCLDAFRHSWDSTIKKADLPRYGWNANPWVWVIEFEKYDKPERKGGARIPKVD